MENKEYKAILVSEIEENKYCCQYTNKRISDLPAGDVLIEVMYSSLNYKDALSASGNKGVTRNYPHTPGIDAAGIVVEDKSGHFKSGEEVLVTGYDLGMNTSGGYQQFISVPYQWVVKLPINLTLKESMIFGTAGFTAGLSVYKLIQSGVKKENGEVLVTGATGGVGSLAVAILAKLGFQVVAATGKFEEKKDYLLSLGATSIISRKDIDDSSNRPLLKSRWVGVIDTVGGNILSTALKMTKYNGSVTCCGLVSSSDFQTSVFPFILKGVSLFGVDSVQCPMDIRLKIWELLSTDWKFDNLESIVQEIFLDQLETYIPLILTGKNTGRIVVKLN